jgi:enamine deaminase RidA (YjgF/YER057c/UK114 family)
MSIMATIQRLHPATRYSEAAIHAGTVYLAGQVADNASQDIGGQTRQVLAAIDRLLGEAGSDKTRILRAQVFLADIADYDGMNAAWDAWVAPGAAPPRATVETRLARPEWRVEIVVTAAAG